MEVEGHVCLRRAAGHGPDFPQQTPCWSAAAFPGTWFVQALREVAAVSRRFAWGKGPESGGLLFLREQNLLAELHLQGGRPVRISLGPAGSKHPLSMRIYHGGLKWGQATSGDTGQCQRHFWLSQLGRECYGHVVGRGQGCCYTPCNAHDSPTTLNRPGRNASSAEAENPGLHQAPAATSHGPARAPSRTQNPTPQPTLYYY